MNEIRLSRQGLRVLQIFSDDIAQEYCGADLIKALRLRSGTLYPILMRFERYGLLESYWEEGNASDMGRPRRRLYRITPSGTQLAREKLTELQGQRLSFDFGGT